MFNRYTHARFVTTVLFQ